MCPRKQTTETKLLISVSFFYGEETPSTNLHITGSVPFRFYRVILYIESNTWSLVHLIMSANMILGTQEKWIASAHTLYWYPSRILQMNRPCCISYLIMINLCLLNIKRRIGGILFFLFRRNFIRDRVISVSHQYVFHRCVSQAH